MGLDIYLRRYENFAQSQETAKKFEVITDVARAEIFDDWNTATKEQKDAYYERRAQIARQLGTDDYGISGQTKIEKPSTKYPDHYFKVGYFRSSYNDSGINSIMRNIGCDCGDLYSLFARERDDEYEFQPDWKAVLGRTLVAIETFTDILRRPVYLAFDHDNSPFRWQGIEEPCSEKDAVKAYRQIVSGSKADGAFSCGAGYFAPKGIKVVGIMQGKQPYSWRSGSCTYIVYEADKENMGWYLHALEIVAETCQFVLEQPDTEKYYLAWSG